MKNSIIINDQVIIKYLAGEATPEEAIALHDWLTMPENKKYFKEMETVWFTAHPSKKPNLINIQDDWVVLDRKTENIPKLSVLKINFVRQNRLFLKIAASLLTGLFLSTIAYSIFSKVTEFTENDIKTVQLPDKTEITLNHNSKLKYSWRYGKRNREIYFSGEAFFRVMEDSAKPFIIQTKIANIKVTGTSFNIICTGQQLEVSVNDGEVMLYTKSDSRFIRTGQTAMILLGAQRIKIGKPADINAWGYATHRFEFRDIPLKEVIYYFNKAYPDSIKILNKNIKNCKLTATFENKSAEYMLTLIAETLDIKLTKNDSIFILDGKGCP